MALRFVKDKTYEVTVPVNGEPVRLKLRALTNFERLQILDEVSSIKGVGGFERAFEALGRVIVEIDGLIDSPVTVLKNLEHGKDRDDIFHGVCKWLASDEQESKNYCSSPERLTPDTVGSAATSAGAEGERA